MAYSTSAYKGARQIVQKCLGLSPEQQLLVIADETTVEVAVVISEAAIEAGVPNTVIVVPRSIQRRIPHEQDLSLILSGAAREARALLTCVSGAPEYLPFRERILEAQWSARTRIGHMPYANVEVLELADVSMERLSADCHRLEMALARGRRLEMVSYAADGAAHQLSVDIGGWERLPVASDGIIDDGSWGNVPSGETYIAPLEGTAHGSVVINGSVPGRIIQPGQEIIFTFRDGRVADIDPLGSPTREWLFRTELDRARAAQDDNWKNLAEIGIGVNPKVKRLTGNMLYDEKASGTAHIALGSNTFMGGNVDSKIHCDMVTKAPTILVDGKMIMERGTIAVSDADWRQDYRQIHLSSNTLTKETPVGRSGAEAAIADDGRLKLVLRPETGRISACYVGDDKTARLAGELYRRLPEDKGWVSIAKLAADTNLSLQVVRQVSQVMDDYGLVKFQQTP